MPDLPRMHTLDEVVAAIGTTMKSAYALLERGRFPIAAVKYAGAWRFTDADVRAFIERREVTNPLFLKKLRGKGTVVKMATALDRMERAS